MITAHLVAEQALLDADKKFRDIEYRLDKGIFATDRDVTADELWARLAVEQEKPWVGEGVTSEAMFNTFAIIAELQARGQAGPL